MAQEEKEDGKPAHFTRDEEFQQRSHNIYLQWGHTLRTGVTASLSWMQGGGGTLCEGLNIRVSPKFLH